jgi:hypothetical protein
MDDALYIGVVLSIIPIAIIIGLMLGGIFANFDIRDLFRTPEYQKPVLSECSKCGIDLEWQHYEVIDEKPICSNCLTQPE